MTPYFYIIKHVLSGKLYVGCQYGKNSSPDNLLINYFTSSKNVKEIIKNEGVKSFVIEFLECRDDAREYENIYLMEKYNQYGKEKFLELYINRNLAPGIVLTKEIIEKANSPRKRKNCSIAAKKLLEIGKHNFQLYPPNTEKNKEKSSIRMKGNKYGKLRNITPELVDLLKNRAIGNTNVRGKKWWYNTTTNEKKRAVSCPGDNWINKCPENLTNEGRLKLKQAASKPKSKKHCENLSKAAKNRESNAKGTIWVVNEKGKKRRVDPNNIPEGFFSVKEIKK